MKESRPYHMANPLLGEPDSAALEGILQGLELAEARSVGVHPFCITVDPHGQDYLPRIYGRTGYTVISPNAQSELPSGSVTTTYSV